MRTMLPVGSLPRTTDIPGRVTLIVFKTGQTYSVASYRIDGAVLNYVLENGTAAGVDM